MATQPLSLRKFIMCFLCVLSRFGGYRVLTCTPCRRNRLSCKKEKRIVPLKCGHKFQWSTLQYNRRIIAGKRHQSLKSKWQSSKWLRTHRLLSETRRMSSILESPIIQAVRSPPPSPPALPRHYCFQLLLRGEHILKSNLNNNYHKQLVGEGGGGTNSVLRNENAIYSRYRENLYLLQRQTYR